jgi:CRISPR/Cas system-associated endonuclease Cas1
MLNYAYALMNAQVRAEVAADGYDPRLGIMHETRPDALAYVLDMIELRRPLVDRAVLRFVFANVFSGADFSIRDDGVCRLTPQLARQLCSVVSAG